jgi:hypothetical protein
MGIAGCIWGWMNYLDSFSWYCILYEFTLNLLYVKTFSPGTFVFFSNAPEFDKFDPFDQFDSFPSFFCHLGQVSQQL